MPTDENVPPTTVFTEPVERVQCGQCGHIVDMRGSEPFSERFCPSCGARKKVPAKLGTYLLLDCIGSGGMGAVFRGLDPSLDRVVAVKVMNRTLGQDPVALESFRKEARAAARLNHPHAAQVFSFGEAHGQPYIVMEFVPGRPLNELVKESGTLDQALVVRVGMQTAEALAVAAAADLLHGDVKPENIMVEESGQSKLIDFGLAAIAEQQTQGQIWGSPYYVAPERILRQKTDFRTDMYSLGATMYEALAGRPPFTGDSLRDVLNAHLAGNPTAVSVYRRDLDPEIERTIMRMLRRQPVERYPNYDSLTGDLRRTLNRLGGYPGHGKRHTIHGTATAFRYRSEAAPQSTSPRAAPDTAAPLGLRSIPETESTAHSATERTTSHPPRMPSDGETDHSAARRQAQPQRDAMRHRDDTSGVQVRREQRPAPVRHDTPAPQKAAQTTPKPQKPKEPNVLPFMLILGGIAIVVIVAISMFSASQSGSQQKEYGQFMSPAEQVPERIATPKAPAGSEQTMDDNAKTKQGRAVAINVLENDATGPGGTLPVISTITNPQNGVASVTRNGVGYRPQPGFTGTDHFQYTVRYPSGKTSTATVTIEVGGN